MAKKMDKNTQIAIGVGILAITGLVIGVGVNQGWFKSSTSKSSDSKDAIDAYKPTTTYTTKQANNVNDVMNLAKNGVEAGVSIYKSIASLFKSKEEAAKTSADGTCYINDYGMIQKA